MMAATTLSKKEDEEEGGRRGGQEGMVIVKYRTLGFRDDPFFLKTTQRKQPDDAYLALASRSMLQLRAAQCKCSPIHMDLPQCRSH